MHQRRQESATFKKVADQNPSTVPIDDKFSRAYQQIFALLGPEKSREVWETLIEEVEYWSTLQTAEAKGLPSRVGVCFGNIPATLRVSVKKIIQEAFE